MIQVPKELWDLQNRRIEKLEEQVATLMRQQLIMGVILFLLVTLGDELVSAAWSQLSGGM